MRTYSPLCKCGKPKLRDGKCEKCLKEYRKEYVKNNYKYIRKQNNENVKYCKGCKKYRSKIHFEKEGICNFCLHIEKKACSLCGKMKNYLEFYKDKSKGDIGLSSRCIECNNNRCKQEKTDEGYPLEQILILQEKKVPKNKWKSIYSKFTLSEIRAGEGEGENFKPKELFFL